MFSRVRQALPRAGSAWLNGGGGDEKLGLNITAQSTRKLKNQKGFVLPFLQDHVHLAKQISTIYTCMWSQLNQKTCNLRTPLFITSQLFPWKHKQWRSTLFPSPQTTKFLRWTFGGATGCQERKTEKGRGVQRRGWEKGGELGCGRGGGGKCVDTAWVLINIKNGN